MGVLEDDEKVRGGLVHVGAQDRLGAVEDDDGGEVHGGAGRDVGVGNGSEVHGVVGAQEGGDDDVVDQEVHGDGGGQAEEK